MFTGEKGSGEFLIATARLVTENDVVIKGSSHWLMDEAPDQGAPRLLTPRPPNPSTGASLA